MSVEFRYNEDQNLEELKRYIEYTYNMHYAQKGPQAFDAILHSGHGRGFCVGNILKYAQRYGNKGDAGAARQDLLKILHYTLLQLYVHDTFEGNVKG